MTSFANFLMFSAAAAASLLLISILPTTSGFDSSEVSVSSCNAFCPRQQQECSECCGDLGYKPHISSCRSRRCLCRNVSPFEDTDIGQGEDDFHVQQQQAKPQENIVYQTHGTGAGAGAGARANQNFAAGCDRHCPTGDQQCSHCCRNDGYNPKISKCEGSSCVCGSW